MSSTNKTTHYNLSQYSASDKPTYLVDYNTDMSNIDTGIYNAQTTANSLEANIGTLTDLTTTAKSNTVAAINEVNTQVGTNTGAISTLNTQVGANTGNIGTMSNLNTTDKTSLVNAINEVNNKKDVYDTTETLTSELWENHPIYRKVFDITWNGATSPAIATGLTGIKVVRLFGTDIGPTGGAFPIPSIRPSQDGYNMGLFYINGTINIQTSGTVDRTGHSGWVCIEYYYDNN